MVLNIILKKLVDNNVIERIGPDNGGYWNVKKMTEFIY